MALDMVETLKMAAEEPGVMKQEDMTPHQVLASYICHFGKSKTQEGESKLALNVAQVKTKSDKTSADDSEGETTAVSTPPRAASACDSGSDSDEEEDHEEFCSLCSLCRLPVGALQYCSEDGEVCHGECLAQMVVQRMRNEEQTRLVKDREAKQDRRAEYDLGWTMEKIPSNVGPATKLVGCDVPQGMCCLVFQEESQSVQVAAALDPSTAVNLEYLSTALEVRLRDGREPMFSLDPVDPLDRHSMQEKRFEPEWLAGTNLGEAMFQADYHLKELSMGEFQQPVLGMRNCCDHAETQKFDQDWSGREWFTVKQAGVKLSSRNILIPEVQMGIEAREQVNRGGDLQDALITRPDHPLVRYAEEFSKNFDLIAERKSVVYHLREVAKASVLAKFLVESGMDLDSTWLGLAEKLTETCSLEVPQLWNERLRSQIRVEDGKIVGKEEGLSAALVHGVYGGVQFGLDKFSLSAGVAASAALRPAAGRLGALSAAVATSAALRPGLPGLAPKAALQTKILASQAISSTRIAPMAGLLSATGAVRPTPSLSAAMRPAQASMLSSAAIRPQAGLLSTAAVRPAAGLSAAMRPTQATMLSTAAIRPQAGLLSTAAVRPAAGLSAAMRPTQASMLSTAAIRPQAGLLSTAAVRPAAGLSAALRPTQASMLSAAAIRPQAGLLSAVGRPAAAVTAAMRPQRSMLSTAAIRPAGLLSSVARPQGVDLNLDQFNLNEATRDAEDELQYQAVTSCIAMGKDFWANLSKFSAADRELLEGIFNPHLTDRRLEGELFVPPNPSPEYVQRLREMLEREGKVRQDRVQHFLSKSFKAEGPGELFPSTWAGCSYGSSVAAAGGALKERPDYAADAQSIFAEALTSTTPAFEKSTEDGMTFRIYRFGSLEVRTTQRHDQECETVGAVFSICSDSASSAISTAGEVAGGERLVKVAEYVEWAQSGRGARAGYFTVFETEKGNRIITELLADGTPTWKENPAELESRLLLAKVLRTASGDALAAVHDARGNFAARQAGVTGRGRASRGQRQRYAETAFKKAARQADARKKVAMGPR